MRQTLWSFATLAAFSMTVGCGCATIKVTYRDKEISRRSERKLLSDWTFSALPSPRPEYPRDAATTSMTVQKDKACSLTDIRRVDRTEVIERTFENERLGRILGYSMGATGAAGAVTNIYFATQARDKDAEIAFGVLGGIGTYFSIALVMRLVFEFSSMDTESRLGAVDVKETKLSRCENAPAAYAKVRLLPMAGGKPLRGSSAPVNPASVSENGSMSPLEKSAEVIESLADKDGTAVFPMDPLKQKTPATYAVEVNGTVVTHVEIPASPPATSVAAPGTP